MSPERLQPEDRERVVAALMTLRTRYPKLKMPKGMIQVYSEPPQESGRMHLRADHDVHLR